MVVLIHADIDQFIDKCSNMPQKDLAGGFKGMEPKNSF
jgi:hypothetical protein